MLPVHALSQYRAVQETDESIPMAKHQTKIAELVNSTDPSEVAHNKVAHNELPHLDLHCLPFSL